MLSVGVDVGGTKIAAGLVDDKGNIVDIEKINTENEDLQQLNADIISLIKKLVGKNNVSSIGIATTGFVSKTRDIILFGTNINHKNYNFKKALQKELAYKIVIENDADAAGWAEYKYGSGKEYESMVMVTSGTGIGGALIINDQLVRGAFGKAGEIGHMKIVPNGRFCSCGLQGCWEAYASGSALVENANNILKSNPKSVENIVSCSIDGKITGPNITKLAFQDDKVAKNLIENVGWWLGLGISNIATIIDPEIIIIGGGVSAGKNILLDGVKKGYESNLSAGAYVEKAPIVLANYDNNAGIIGVADLSRK